MKTKITLLALLITMLSFAQNGINYKAVIKDGSGNVVAGNLIEVQFNILRGGVAQTNVYSEKHTPTTDANGLIILNIGEGAVISGSPAFSTINWGSDDHFLNVKVNTGSGLTDMGTTEFKTVPYALSSEDNQWVVNGTSIRTKNFGNVGIGENNPTAKLDVNGNMKLQYGAAVNEFSTDGNLTGNSNTAVPTESAVKTYVGNNTFWSPSGTNIVNANSGKVGIGTSNPTSKLHILSPFSYPALSLESFGDDRAILRFSKNGSTFSWDQVSGIRTNDASGTMSFYYNNNNVMTLRGDGKVGINTFNPTKALDVVGDVKVSGELNRPSTGLANMVPIAYGTFLNTEIYNGSGNFTITETAGDNFIIRINGEYLTERDYMIIIVDPRKQTDYQINSGFIIVNQPENHVYFIVYKP